MGKVKAANYIIVAVIYLNTLQVNQQFMRPIFDGKMGTSEFLQGSVKLNSTLDWRVT